MRQLYIIPIIHSKHDLGSLEKPIKDLKKQVTSEAVFESNQKLVDSFWRELQSAISSWNLDFSNALVFQDALPFTGHPDRVIEHKIVAELADKGSANHRLVRWLIEQGARLEGTESTELLLKEYDAVRKALADGIYRNAGAKVNTWSIESGESLLMKRDQFIAGRIMEALSVSQFGILFIGMLHRVEEYLSPDFQVEFPFGKLATATG